MELHTEAGVFDLPGEHILVNDVPVLPGERNPYNMRLWVIGHEYGPIVALWATNEQDALDDMLDQGYQHFLVAPEDVDANGDYAYLGNASEPCNLDYAWIHPVPLEKERDFKLCIDFTEARVCGSDNLEQWD